MLYKMARVFGIAILLSCLLIQTQSQTFDITTFGAKADGSDISKGLSTAWSAACSSSTASKIVIPSGTYGLTQIMLKGPCKAPVELQVQGTVLAPEDPAAMNKDGEWVTVQYVDHFTLSGNGVFDGRGSAKAWKQNECRKTALCNKLPYNFAFNFITNSAIKDITSKDSKLFHILVFESKNVSFSGIRVVAPGDSPNTDGIHIGHSSGVSITSTDIKTGDDCVSIGDGSQQINITRVTCGPGHGISVGSLGRYPNEQPVDGIFVKDCSLSNTLNGVRIKSWPAAEAGIAKNIHFENIKMNNVSNPIIIDQEYCPNNQCKLTSPSKVKISNVSFNSITGSSATPALVSMTCSKSLPCDGVVVGDVHLDYTGTEGQVTSAYQNVKPTFVGTQSTAVIAAASTQS